MTFRDTLQTSTTVCPAVMADGPSMVTVGGGAVGGGREGRKFIMQSVANNLHHLREKETLIVRQL